jgi:ABC-type multidrug transport system permease subunit
MRRPNPVALRASFGTRKPVPGGYQHSVPGIMVMSILMNLLLFGGASIAGERREGVLKRLMVQPLSRPELILGKITGLLLLGAVQAGFLLAVGALFMHVSLAGNAGLVILTIAVFSWASAASGILIGSVLAREDKVVAVCVLASMVMAALGGCWWPLEVVPEHVRMAGHIFPTAWAMDAFHQLISFGGGWREIRGEIAALALLAAAATYGAMRFFRV